MSTVRLVIDPPPLTHCLRAIDDRELCGRAHGHAGGCLPFPHPWPVRDITRENPATRKADAA